ncbi:hypothetical protein LOTGIDRAFT_157845 [Lottia gigantea]|uniref:Dynein heavy chain ATP-binding dynein motor region domain-containing protein n=1 Tax=Lottia gigantea TaxID=225164 RepID=V4ATF5_LOTGI|nr:hypothetical protein LOTGIDRAFT_157845 [Lottia gigantea]ESP00568.1 hypothetical protein LOTGIDRAFT_157845 [Lottia gigantea]
MSVPTLPQRLHLESQPQKLPPPPQLIRPSRGHDATTALDQTTILLYLLLPELPGVKIGLKKLAGVLFDDIGDHLKTSGKWPLVIDETGQAATFLKYRDCNCLNTLEKIDMEPERLRKALIGSLRFGKPFVIDMMDADMFQLVTERLDEIQKGLMDSILDRSILNEDK